MSETEGHIGHPLNGAVNVVPPPWQLHVPAGHEQSTEQLSLRNVVMHPPSVGPVPPLPLPPHMTPPLDASGPESVGAAPLELPDPVELLLMEPELDPLASAPPELLLLLEPPPSDIPPSPDATWLPPHATTRARSKNDRGLRMVRPALCQKPRTGPSSSAARRATSLSRHPRDDRRQRHHERGSEEKDEHDFEGRSHASWMRELPCPSGTPERAALTATLRPP
jgi:hypothetical protein